MAGISASAVKELRERTGLGMMDCKNALVQASGDMELAIETLRKSSGIKAAKKAGRIAADGIICSRVEGGLGVIVEVNCETDFAAKNDDFVAFANSVTEQVFERRSSNLAALDFEDVREKLSAATEQHHHLRMALEELRQPELGARILICANLKRLLIFKTLKRF